MAVWKVTETHAGRKGGLKEGMERDYTRVFRVFTNSKLDGVIEAMFAVDPGTGEAIPAIYSPYVSYLNEESDIFALCRSITPVQDDDDWTVWLVTCEYSTKSITGDDRMGQPEGGSGAGGNPGTGSGSSNDPSLEPPVQEWGEWHREEAQTRDASNDQTVIATVPVGEPFDPPPTREIGGTVLILERNELTYDVREKNSFRFTLNEGDFVWEGDAEKWLCKPITARRQYKGPFKYWRVRYEFWHCGDAETWDHVLLNAGYLEMGDDGVTPRPIVFGTAPPSKPWPIFMSNGAALDPIDVANNLAEYVNYRKYKRLPWNRLSIVVDDS